MPTGSLYVTMIGDGLPSDGELLLTRIAVVVVSYLGVVWLDYRTDLVSQNQSGGIARRVRRLEGGGGSGLGLLGRAWGLPLLFIGLHGGSETEVARGGRLVRLQSRVIARIGGARSVVLRLWRRGVWDGGTLLLATQEWWWVLFLGWCDFLTNCSWVVDLDSILGPLLG